MTTPAAPLCVVRVPFKSHDAKVRRPSTRTTGPLSPGAALTLRALIARRQELATATPEVLEVAASALDAMRAAAFGVVPEIAADRTRRHRAKQLHGEKTLPLEDVVALAMAGERGRGVALAGLRALAGALDHVVLPAVAPAEPFEETARAAFRRFMTLGDALLGGVDRAALLPHVVALNQSTAGLEQHCRGRVS